MTDEAKAVEEVAKTAGKAIDAGREMGGFIAKYIAGSLEQAMGIVEDRLKYMRFERLARMMQKTESLRRETSLLGPIRAVPLKLFIPIMQGASLEEDDDLQDRWAALLANAADASFSGEVRRSYVTLLEQITALDARILDLLYSLPFETSQHDGIVTAALPNAVRSPEKDQQDYALPPDEVIISLSNLARLGCLRPGMTWGGGESFGRVNPTIAGRAFVEACRPHAK